MGDWMISKKRFWGLALPIWVDEVTGEFEVIGSREELKERAVEGWHEFEGRSPHRPWIDQVKIRNPKTGNLMSRIPDVGNPWLDAGIVPLSTMKYNTDREYWEKWFPADFVTEAFPGQFRNWFYAMLAMSTMMVGRAPFKNLLGHAHGARPDTARRCTRPRATPSRSTAPPTRGLQEIRATRRARWEEHPPMGADLDPLDVIAGTTRPATSISAPAPPTSCAASSRSSSGTPTPSSATTPGSTASTRRRRRCR